MPKRDPTADAIATLAALKSEKDLVSCAATLEGLLADKSGYVVSRAAELAADRGVRAVLPQVSQAFVRWLDLPASRDPGCTAKAALARALVKLEAGFEAEEALLRGIRHTHWEATWGGQVDLAVPLRGQCAIGLAAMASRSALPSAVELLAETDAKAAGRERISWPVRADAARALTMIGSEAAGAVLRFKALLGDSEPAVVSECLAGVIAIEGDDGLAFAERFLEQDAAGAEAALLAIGGSRRPTAFALLQRYADRFITGESCSAFIAAVALTRQDAAIDYLLDIVSDGDAGASAAAVDALTPLRSLQRIADRLDAARARRDAGAESRDGKRSRR